MPRVRESGMPEEVYWASFFDPACVLTALDCKHLDGDIVEFGCGYGTFTAEAARRTTGKVLGIDIDPDMIARASQRMIAEGHSNVSLERRDFIALGSGCDDEQADYALLFNILHLENPVALLCEAFRILRPGGQAGIIHWNCDPTTPRGPSMEIRPRPEQCIEWAKEAGFELRRNEALSCCPHHYGIVVARPNGVRSAEHGEVDIKQTGVVP